MKRFLLPLGLAGLLLTTTPVLAADPELTEKEKLNRILQDLETIKRDMESLRTVGVQIQAAMRDVRDLQRRVDTLEQSVERLLPGRTRVSASYTPTAPATATIQIQNRSEAAATVYVNGQPYSVAAHQTANIPGVPPGSFNYEVQAEGFGVIRPTVSRTVSANETFSIFINPPAPQLLLVP